jgi:hypothetical protein
MDGVGCDDGAEAGRSWPRLTCPAARLSRSTMSMRTRGEGPRAASWFYTCAPTRRVRPYLGLASCFPLLPLDRKFVSRFGALIISSRQM